MASGERVLAWTALAVPLAASLAAQTVWAWRTGSVVLLVWGVVSVVILALSIHRWRRIPPGRHPWIRNATMAGVVVAVGGWTWLHTSLLLISELPDEPNPLVHTLSVGLAIAAFLPIEGLAVLSVLSLDDGPAASTSDRRPGRVRRRWRRLAAWIHGDRAAAATSSWGPAGVVDRDVDGPASATVSDIHARPRPAPAPASSTVSRPPSSTVRGWSESMAAVTRGVDESSRDWTRRRASTLGLPQSTPAGRVQRAELDRARSTRTPGTAPATVDEADDDREGVSA